MCFLKKNGDNDMSDLQKKIDARIRQAEKKEFAAKAQSVARCLGERVSREDDGYSETAFNFKNGEFRIEDVSGFYDDGKDLIMSYETQIYYRGEKVFAIGGGVIHSYVPGDWEKSFNGLHDRAQAVIKSRENPTREMPAPASFDDADERRNWGL
jgi:hypothetical protein